MSVRTSLPGVLRGAARCALRGGALAALAVAFCVAPAHEPAHAQDAQTEFRERLARGRAELAEGHRERARHHLLGALALDPTSLDAQQALLTADLADDELRRLWQLHAASAGVNDKGRWTPPSGWSRELKADSGDAAGLVKDRVAAARAVRSVLAKQKGAEDAPAALYLAGLLRTLTAPLLSLHADTEEVIDDARKATLAKPDKVTKALAQVMRRALAAGELTDALEAARLIRGLHQQGGQADGAAPQDDDASREARDVIDKVRARLLAQEKPDLNNPDAKPRKVWTLAELEAIPPAERPQWNAEHSSWGNPGVAVSPTGRYRIETAGGLSTLLFVTRDVELHHARLVRWYGADPFMERQGLVRIAHSYADFEREGQPFWWAGGFQQGDITTLFARFSTSGDIGSTLTHELTHRFDGALLRGMSTWLVEGRAVYTESCSLYAAAENLDERVIQHHRLWETNSKKYGEKESFEKLLAGTIDDYRHNYDAGYSLWLFLVRFKGFDDEQQGTPVFASRVQGYVEDFAKNVRTKPVERFVHWFVDGKDGRPATLDEFCRQLAKFLREGGQGGDVPEWRKVWDEDNRKAFLESGGSRRLEPIWDEATLPRSRTRHDASDHGTYHAYDAGVLLARAGQRDAAIEAFHWALLVDEPEPARFAEIAAQDREAGEKDAAWLLELLAHRMDRVGQPAPSGGPPRSVSAAASKVLSLLDTLSEQATAQETAKRPVVARALLADRDALASWVAAPPLSTATAPVPAPEAEPDAPLCHPYRAAIGPDLIEERWSPLDSEVKGLWRTPSPALLELGRKEVGNAQSGQVRDAGIRRVFVRGTQYHTGTYTFRARVRLVSAYADTRLVIGHTHHDRGVRIRLVGGDWSYAVGTREEHLPLRFVRVRLDDLRPYESLTTPLDNTIEFETPRESFEVVVHVSGSYVRVLIDGQVAVAHRRVTGTPVEGHVGFGLHSGIVAYEDARVRQHRVAGPDAVCPCDAHDGALDLSRPSPYDWESATGRRVIGIPTGARPILLAWFDKSWPEGDRTEDLLRQALRPYELVIERTGMPVELHVAVPASAEGAEPFAEPGAFGLPKGRVHVHHGHAGLRSALDRVASEQPQGGFVVSSLPLEPTWLLLDSQRVVRTHGPLGSEDFVWRLGHLMGGW